MVTGFWIARIGLDFPVANLMDRIRQNNRVVFVSEPSGLEHIWRTMTGYHKEGANFWTDTYLAALAGATGHTLVTFDRGFGQYKNLSVRILGGQHP